MTLYGPSVLFSWSQVKSKSQAVCPQSGLISVERALLITRKGLRWSEELEPGKRDTSNYTGRCAVDCDVSHGEADGYVDHMTNGVSLPENEVKLYLGIKLRE